MGQQVVWMLEESGQLEASGSQFFPIMGELHAKECMVPFQVQVDHEIQRELEIQVEIVE